jgi:hypothetical protein
LPDLSGESALFGRQKAQPCIFYEFQLLKDLKTFIDEKRWRDTQQQARIEKIVKCVLS